MATLPIHPLTAEAFAPFGDVIETEGHDHKVINEGYAKNFFNLAQLEVDREGGRAGLHIFTAQPVIYPLEIKLMERHPLGSQAFMPLQDSPFLMVVAEPGDNLQPGQLRAFISNGRQGINYRPGVWHYPLLVLNPDERFLIVDRIGEQPNCDLHHFAEGEFLTLQPETD